MSDISTGARRGIAFAFISVMVTTTACGTQTEAPDVTTSVPGAVVQQAPFVTSADAAERRGAQKPQQKQPPTSADAAERRGAQKNAEKPTVPQRRVPDSMP